MYSPRTGPKQGTARQTRIKPKFVAKATPVGSSDKVGDSSFRLQVPSLLRLTVIAFQILSSNSKRASNPISSTESERPFLHPLGSSITDGYFFQSLPHKRQTSSYAGTRLWRCWMTMLLSKMHHEPRVISHFRGGEEVALDLWTALAFAHPARGKIKTRAMSKMIKRISAPSRRCSDTWRAHVRIRWGF